MFRDTEVVAMRKVLCFSAIVVMIAGLGSLGCMDTLTKISPPTGKTVPNGATNKQAFTGGNVRVTFPEVFPSDAQEEVVEP